MWLCYKDKYINNLKVHVDILSVTNYSNYANYTMHVSSNSHTTIYTLQVKFPS